MTTRTLYTNEALFNVVVGILKEKNLLPDTLSQSYAESWDIAEIKDFDWEVSGCFDFSTDNETYINLYAKGETGNDSEEIRLGGFAVKDKSRDAFYILSRLQVDFIFETRAFVEEHIDDFDWSDTP